MALDLELLAGKISRIREQHQLSMDEVSLRTGISLDRLSKIEKAVQEPSGDEILILADLYKCDFRYFISNERMSSLEKAEQLFRLLGDELSADDRLAISEFFFLCETEASLRNSLSRKTAELPILPAYVTGGNYFKDHGKRAALFLRQTCNLSDLAIVPDVFGLIRSLGVHLFRRKLQSSIISGTFIKHPAIGDCILINYDEDIFRQRFSAMHELGHALFDRDLELVVSGHPGKWTIDKLREIRADTFAASFLCHPEMLKKIPDVANWNENKAVDFARRLQVNTKTLAIALENEKLVDPETKSSIESFHVPKNLKTDPEIPAGLPVKSKERKRELLEMGLSQSYVQLCFDAYCQEQISTGKLAELLLVELDEVDFVADTFGTKI